MCISGICQSIGERTGIVKLVAFKRVGLVSRRPIFRGREAVNIKVKRASRRPHILD